MGARSLSDDAHPIVGTWAMCADSVSLSLISWNSFWKSASAAVPQDASSVAPLPPLLIQRVSPRSRTPRASSSPLRKPTVLATPGSSLLPVAAFLCCCNPLFSLWKAPCAPRMGRTRNTPRSTTLPAATPRAHATATAAQAAPPAAQVSIAGSKRRGRCTYELGKLAKKLRRSSSSSACSSSMGLIKNLSVSHIL